MYLRKIFLAIQVAAIGAAQDLFREPEELLVHKASLVRRADNVRLSLNLSPLRNPFDQNIQSAWALSVDIRDRSSDGSSSTQRGFKLMFDTGSDETWVMSDLIRERYRRNRRVYRTPSDVFHQRIECRRDTYHYAMGSVDVELFDTTLIMGSRDMREFELGAASYITDDFREISDETGGNGITGWAPPAARDLMGRLRVGDVSRFLFDARNRAVSFGDFTSATTWAETISYDHWVIGAASTNDLGNTLIDTATTAIKMTRRRVDRYFRQWPASILGLFYGNTMIDCAANLDELPDLIILINRKDFSLRARELKGGEVPDARSDNGKRWCASQLQPRVNEEGEGGVETVLGLNWIRHFQVIFDATDRDEAIGIRYHGR